MKLTVTDQILNGVNQAATVGNAMQWDAAQDKWLFACDCLEATDAIGNGGFTFSTTHTPWRVDAAVGLLETCFAGLLEQA